MPRKDFYHDTNAPKANSIVAAASAVVIDSECRLLLHRRSDNGLWSLLGGGMELGESIAQTIVREVKEESGFDVSVHRLIGIYSDPRHIIAFDDGEVRQQFSVCFECHIIGGSLAVSSESTQLTFFTRQEISHVELHPSQKLRVDDYFKRNERAFVR